MSTSLDPPTLASPRPLGTTAVGHPELIPYEKRLDQNSRWALTEGSVFFEDKGAVQQAMRRIAKRLDELGIPYAIVGGMALFQHGVRRFTEDVDILVTREGLKAIHEKLEGRGYLQPFTGSKHLRDTELGVKVEFLVAGGFPGDGKPKPVAFPDPASVAEVIDGRKYIRLTSLIELKLASGMSSEQRGRDLLDIQELIKAAHLPLDLVDQLNPYVQEKYRALWLLVWPVGRRYLRAWPCESLTKETLDGLLAEGLTVDSSRSADPQYVFLETTNPQLAFRYDMPDESEYRDL
jgi:hypothetical protein